MPKNCSGKRKQTVWGVGNQSRKQWDTDLPTQSADTRALQHKVPRGLRGASDIKIRTAPQQERSDTLKVRRGLHEHMLDLTKHCTHHEKWTLKMSNAVFSRFRALFDRGLQSTAAATKIEPEAPEVLHLPHGIIIIFKPKMTTVSQKGTFDPFKTSSKFIK